MSDFRDINDKNVKANQAKQLLNQAHAEYQQAGVPTDVLQAMVPHIAAAVKGYRAKHLGLPMEADPETHVSHLVTLGDFGGAPKVGKRLQRLFRKHGI